jgi:hypothetical protein
MGTLATKLGSFLVDCEPINLDSQTTAKVRSECKSFVKGFAGAKGA